MGTRMSDIADGAEFTRRLTAAAVKNGMGELFTPEKCEKLLEFTRYLLKYNENVNLTAIRDAGEVILRHLIDSAAVLKYTKIPDRAALVDIGTGAGFPAFPCAVLRPDIHVTAVDSVRKKTDFITSAACLLDIGNITAVNERGERLGRTDYRGRFDVAAMRAVSNGTDAVEIAVPLLKIGGVFILMRGKMGINAETELKSFVNAASELGAEYERTEEFTLTDGDETIDRKLMLFRKRSPTPEKYPRNYSQIGKNPLR